MDAQLAHARRGLAQFDALVGITYPGEEVPYPTSVALVVRWMAEHYAEHVPHAQALFAEWKKAR